MPCNRILTKTDCMTLFNILGLASTVSLVLPIGFLLYSGLAWYRSFPALFFYYVLLLSYNLILLGYIPMDSQFRYYHGVINNLLDTPLILLFLMYFSNSVQFRKIMTKLIIGFVGLEVLVIALFGINVKAITVILAPGLILALILSLQFFRHHVKIAVVHQKATGKAMMVSSLVFAYVGYCFVYAVFYLIKPAQKNDAHLVFFLITVFSSIAMAAGIYFERFRVRQLAELKITRNELRKIYGEQQEEEEPKLRTASNEAILVSLSNNKGPKRNIFLR